MPYEAAHLRNMLLLGPCKLIAWILKFSAGNYLRKYVTSITAIFSVECKFLLWRPHDIYI